MGQSSVSKIGDAHKPFKKFSLIICSIPGAVALWFLLYVGRAYMVLGRWPTPYNPDPKELGFVFHHISIYLLFPVAFLGFVGIIASITTAFIQNYSKKFVALLVGVSIISSVLFCMIFLFNFGNFMIWFLD